MYFLYFFMNAPVSCVYEEGLFRCLYALYKAHMTCTERNEQMTDLLPDTKPTKPRHNAH